MGSALTRVRGWLGETTLVPALLGVAGVALLVRSPVIGLARETPDTPLYMEIAEGLLHGPDAPGAHPLDTIRTPGYPILLAAAKLLPGGDAAAASTLQSLLGVLAAVAVAAAGWRYFGRATAVLAGLVMALSTVFVHNERLLTPDFVFGLALFAGAVLLAEALLAEGLRVRLLVAAGVVFGLAAYIKPSGMAMVLVGLLPLALLTRDLRTTLKGAAIVAASCALVFAPWVVRNALVYDYPNMSSIGGVTLFLKTFDIDGLPVPTDKPHGEFVAGVRAQAAQEAYPSQAYTDYEVLNALRRQGRSFQEAADIERDLALTAAWRDPRIFAEGAWQNVRGMFDGLTPAKDSREGLEDDSAGRDLSAMGVVVRRLWTVGGILVDVWARLCAGGLLLLLLPFLPDRRARVAGTVLLGVWLVTAAATGLTTWVTFSDPRFALQGAPLMVLGGSASMVFVAGAARARLRPDRASPPSG